ncbi:hypothetical protein [Polycladomyces subterraneus]|uniref:G-protein coupled receptors family 1 profile domain-containing protein n=1 Tax=Polycladomyces subterraneus TaxID=1016997 RepID=A0ABT8IJ87_9BACL|nr:hypothetical protein [Polycladomyces subterraneus]MDN4592621.1 hypothetical protein [Polycladomyces subterraneus]
MSYLVGITLTIIASIILLVLLMLIFGVATVTGWGSEIKYMLEHLNSIQAMIVGMTAIVLYFLFYLAIISFFVGGYYGPAVQAVFEDRVTIGSFFRYGYRFVFRFAGKYVLIVILGLLLVLPSVLLIATSHSDWVKSIGVIWYLFVYVYLIIWVSHSHVIMIAENEKVFRSVKLAWLASWRKWGQSLLTFLMILAWFAAPLVLILPLIPLSENNLALKVILGILAFLTGLYYIYLIAVIPLLIVWRYKMKIRPAIIPTPPPGPSGEGPHSWYHSEPYRAGSSPNGPQLEANDWGTIGVPHSAQSQPYQPQTEYQPPFTYQPPSTTHPNPNQPPHH